MIPELVSYIALAVLTGFATIGMAFVLGLAEWEIKKRRIRK